MDYSFLKLYDSIEEALDDDLFKDRQLSYYIPVQLLPNEAYSQQTNYEGGISFQNNFTISIVDNCENLLKDITNHVFIEEFTDEQGFNQCKIEIININEDFYGRAVFLRFKNNVGNDTYFTRPIKITNKDKEKTYRFDYTDVINKSNLPYENSQFEQSIRLNLKFKDFNNKSEVSDYRQASTGHTISGLEQMSLARDFLSEQIDTFSFVRLQRLLFHNIIYIDGVRLTNKPILEQGGRIGQSNLMKASFTAYVNEDDKKSYEYQIFDGLEITNLYPFGLYTLPNLGEEIIFQFNTDIQINTGSLSIYTSANDLIVSFDESDMSVYESNGVIIENLLTHITVNDDYYIVFDAGLISSVNLDIDYNGISDNTTWTFSVVDADYSSSDYNNEDYFIE